MTNMRGKESLRLISALLCLSQFAPAHSASFPCENASSLQEKLVCSEPGLSRLDEELASTYSQALASDETNTYLRNQQREWLVSERNRCKDAVCLERAYKERIKAIASFADTSVGRLHSEIVLSTYLGGKGDDRANSIQVDNTGSIYIGGYTQYWDNFPALNAFQDKRRGDYSGVVARFSPSGTLLWATHLGGISNSGASSLVHNVVTGLALASGGGIYVAGDTSASDFPTLNASQSEAQSINEAYLSKFDGNGRLVWSTYIGSHGIRFIRAVASDSRGAIYLAGHADLKCVVAKFDSSGKFVWKKDFGGTTHRTEANAIALDGSGNIYIGGSTGVRELPKQKGNPFHAKGKWLNPYIAKFDPNGEPLWSTKLGGADDDNIAGIATDQYGAVYVVGNTKSNSFPTLNASIATRPGRDDAFVAKYSPDGELLWSTYLGATGNDGAKAVVVDRNGYIHVTGYTASTQFPTINAFQAQKAGLVNAYVTTYDSVGKIVRSSYLGGNGFDIPFAMTTDQEANVYVTGYAGSQDFPLKNPHQITSGGLNDIFVTKIGALK